MSVYWTNALYCFFFGHKWIRILEQPPRGYYEFCQNCLEPKQ